MMLDLTSAPCCWWRRRRYPSRVAVAVKREGQEHANDQTPRPGSQNPQTPPRSAHHYEAARSRAAQMAARARSGTRQAGSAEQGEAPAGGISLKAPGRPALVRRPSSPASSWTVSWSRFSRKPLASLLIGALPLPAFWDHSVVDPVHGTKLQTLQSQDARVAVYGAIRSRP
jgi:hypothetical protein